MTIGTNGAEIIYWIYYVFMIKLANHFYMMDMNHSLKFFAVGFAEIKSTDHCCPR